MKATAKKTRKKLPLVRVEVRVVVRAADLADALRWVNKALDAGAFQDEIRDFMGDDDAEPTDGRKIVEVYTVGGEVRP